MLPPSSSTAVAGAIETYQLNARNTIIAYNGGYANATVASSGGFSDGGGLRITQGSAPAGSKSEILNCTIAYNECAAQGQTATLEGGAIITDFTDDSIVTIINSILWANKPNQISGGLTVRYSDVQGGATGTGNIDRNPIFESQYNLVLVEGSFCEDAGDPNSVYNDISFPPSLGSLRNDMGAYGGPGAQNWTVGNPPVISLEPQSQISYLGETISFNVEASGTEPLSYQWLLNTNPILSQTNKQMSLTSLQIDNAGIYTVAISNAFGSVTSAPAQLVVYEARMDLQMYAGMNISGQSGRTYILSYTTDINNGTWTTLATNTMVGTNWFYLDMDSVSKQKRFYKVNLKR